MEACNECACLNHLRPCGTLPFCSDCQFSLCTWVTTGMEFYLIYFLIGLPHTNLKFPLPHMHKLLFALIILQVEVFRWVTLENKNYKKVFRRSCLKPSYDTVPSSPVLSTPEVSKILGALEFASWFLNAMGWKLGSIALTSSALLTLDAQSTICSVSWLSIFDWSNIG